MSKHSVSVQLKCVTTLAFDVFGTILDLTGSLVSPINQFLKEKDSIINPSEFWDQWRNRQRLEQFSDSLLMLGHAGYLETCRKALIYCLRANQIDFSKSDVDSFMDVWHKLDPFEDAVEGLELLKNQYRLIALSNGDRDYLQRITLNRIRVEFDALFSVDEVGVFKPHPAVYRTAAKSLGLDHHEIMMVSAHSFDVVGARACGYRGAYVNRYGIPFENEAQFSYDVEVTDFYGLAKFMLSY